MRKLTLLLMFVLGLAMGSFYNVVIYRVPRGESIVLPFSRCTSCGHKLSTLDLIPVISFVFLLGKCRYCGTRISLRYPLVELFTAIGFAGIAALSTSIVELAASLLLFSLMLIIALIDLDHRIIPDNILIVGAAIVLIILLVNHLENVSTERIPTLIESFWGAAVSGGITFAIALATKGGMGGGDVKLSTVIGLMLGLKASLVALIISFVLGALVGTLLLLMKKARRKDAIPFGPFLAAGAVIAHFYSSSLITWYANLTGLN